MSSYMSSKVPSYMLLVQAFDSGSPAMSTTVTVNIDIADVNDNAPVFAPENASAVIQVCAQDVQDFPFRNGTSLNLQSCIRKKNHLFTVNCLFE